MRTQAIAMLTVLLAIAAALSACGRDNAAVGGGTGAPAAAGAKEERSAESNAAPAMRTVATASGDVDIPADPQRIVATYYIGELASLGIKPVGTVTRLLGEMNPNLAPYTEAAAQSSR